jgi:hypothetical protein
MILQHYYLKMIKKGRGRFLYLILFVYSISLSLQSYSQSLGRISGTIKSETGEAIPYATVSIKNFSLGTSTNLQGSYTLFVPSNDSLIIEVSSLGYIPKVLEIDIKSGERRVLDLVLEVDVKSLEAVSIVATQRQYGNIERIEHRDIKYIPNASGSFEAILKSLPGVSSSNELSSQYSVRGGNFDENLVYVNDVEIYRPFLIRSGQQEGLSFINSDLVETVEFSAGGFNAEFGDKMSSVLNIRYRKPSSNSAKAEISLLGTSAMLEGTTKGGRFTHLSGIRYKTSEYLLGTLDEKGDYNPTFIDFQSILYWKISNTFQLSFLGNYSRNSYQFAPRERETRFGTINNALQLKVYYEGQEMNRFETMQSAFTGEFRPSEATILKFIAGSYIARESETFDVLGQYLINELDNSLGSNTYGDSSINVGIGGFLNHARNLLDVYILRAEHLGSYVTENNKLKWGFRYQREIMNDEINEWDLIDSSGYAVPYNGNELNLTYSLKSGNSTTSNRFSGFIQEGFKFDIANWQATATLGVRFTYWDFNKLFNLSPRISLMLKPSGIENLSFHFSGGYYHQPPIYKEFRTLQGNLNTSIKSQESIHIVAGTEFQFTSWERPFKLQAEAYYKILDNIIPYKIENVRIRYAGENLARGYVQGVDLKINGEFVKGAQSWASLSLMQAYEDIRNDSYIDGQGNEVQLGFYPRPTDQRVSIGLFFQDYVPSKPNLKVHLSGHYGTGVPFSRPKSDRYDPISRMPSYKRVDIGFTGVLKDENGKAIIRQLKSQAWLKSLWVGAEIFNLFDFNNTVSYLWVQTVSNQSNQSGQYAVPNYLTSRRLNVKITATF